MIRNLNIGEKANDWTIISEPIIIKGKRHRKIKCSCGNEATMSEHYINKSTFSKSCRSCSQIRRREGTNQREYSVGDMLMNLKVLHIYHSPLVYVVQCTNCGHEYRTGHTILNKKKNGKGLNCCHNCFNVNMKSTKKFHMLTKNISLTFYNKTQHQANLRGIEFNVSPEYLESIFTGYCYLSGIKLEIGTYSRANNKLNMGNASIDRINSDIGYIEGNVSWVYKPINTMKNVLTCEEFINICNRIVEHNAPS